MEDGRHRTLLATRFSTLNTIKSLFVLSALLLAACASQASIESVKSSAYHTQPRRLFIMANLADGFTRTLEGDLSSQLQSAVVNSLEQCGVDASFHNVGGLTIDDPIGAQLRAYAPDSLLAIQWMSEKASGAVPMEIMYRLQLTDLRMKKVVWKADLSFAPKWQRVEVFTSTLIEKMKADNLIPASCNGGARPAAASPAAPGGASLAPAVDQMRSADTVRCEDRNGAVEMRDRAACLNSGSVVLERVQ